MWVPLAFVPFFRQYQRQYPSLYDLVCALSEYRVSEIARRVIAYDNNLFHTLLYS